MALSTYKTYLMYKASGASDYTKLVDIKNVPAIGAERNTIDVTSLTDDMEQMIPGIKRVGDGFQFNANYDMNKYYEIDQMGDTEYEFAIWKGGTGEGTNAVPSGADGKWSFSGRVTVGTAEGDVDAAFEMVITVFPSSSVAFSKT
jgi:hypothetical protein